MFDIEQFQRVDEYEWIIPVGTDPVMKAPVRLFASLEMLELAKDDRSIQQAMNVTALPGIVGEVVVMPDMHQGHGFPIGGVAATEYPGGVISPGGIGYDINCGVRLLASNIYAEEVTGVLEEWAFALDHACPSGVASDSEIRLSEKDLAQVCLEGARWAQKNGMATVQDLRRTEENGCIHGADPTSISQRAFQRGRTQLGTLGSGNHFLEVDIIDKVYDLDGAAIMGLVEGCLVIQIHCGSRGFGHQICTDYVRAFQDVVNWHGLRIPDRELVYASLDSSDGQGYLAAMTAAANFAFCNRQILAHQARQASESVLAGHVKNPFFHQVYDVAHNVGKIETHMVAGKEKKVCVHRKGATRAFAPGSAQMPEEYSQTGQPVFVPGSMGSASWVLTGAQGAMERSFGSCCHGAGRLMSRSAAKRDIAVDALLKRMTHKGITVRAQSMRGLAEEAPEAYKDVDKVIECVEGVGLAKPVARLVPLIVVKG
ncbi:MAG: RtcB family protein [Anaerolineae bacterium]|nr:RtcB family protein [Anaerolineae bacterium]